MYSPKKLTQTIKSITARKFFEWKPELKKKLWASSFWTSGYFISSVGQHGNEATIANCVRNQGKGKKKPYKQILKQQLTLF